MHGELEDAALAVGGVELALEDVEHARRRRVGPERRGAVHVEVHRVVADPLDRQLHYAGLPAIHLELVAIHVRHQRRVVEEPHLLRDRERMRAEVPRRRADAHGPFPSNLFQGIRGAHLQLALGFLRQFGIALVDPAVDADLVALGGDAPLLVRIEKRGHRRHEEGCLHIPQDGQDARHALAIPVLPLGKPADRLAAFAQLVGLVVGVERERYRAARAAVPGLRTQRLPGAHAVHDLAPALLGVLPRLQAAFVFHCGNGGMKSSTPRAIAMLSAIVA